METKKVSVKLRLDPDLWSALKERAEAEYRLADAEAVVLLRRSLGLAAPETPSGSGDTEDEQ